MGKSLSRDQIREEAASLANMSEADAKTTIGAMNLDMTSRALLKAEIAGMRATATNAGHQGPENLLVAGVMGGATTAAIADRVKKLLSGESRSFPDRLSLKELARRLMTRLSDLDFAVGIDTISVSIRESTRLICVVRLVAVDGGGTSATMSRPETKQVKQAAGSFLGNLAKKAFGGELANAASDLIQQGSQLVGDVSTTVGDMVQLEAILSTIEDYANELAQTRQATELAERRSREQAMETQKRATTCDYCGAARPSPAAGTCESCGATLQAVQS